MRQSDWQTPRSVAARNHMTVVHPRGQCQWSILSNSVLLVILSYADMLVNVYSPRKRGERSSKDHPPHEVWAVRAHKAANRATFGPGEPHDSRV